jgi:HlyD family secretion protein
VRAGYLEIRAPNAGVVKDLATTTRGAVVAAGTVLMNIVPRDEPLQAELRLRNEDVGFIAVGQPARVKVAAYPFQKHGMLDGEVTLVGADDCTSYVWFGTTLVICQRWPVESVGLTAT